MSARDRALAYAALTLLTPIVLVLFGRRGVREAWSVTRESDWSVI